MAAASGCLSMAACCFRIVQHRVHLLHCFLLRRGYALAQRRAVCKPCVVVRSSLRLFHKMPASRPTPSPPALTTQRSVLTIRLPALTTRLPVSAPRRPASAPRRHVSGTRLRVSGMRIPRTEIRVSTTGMRIPKA
jgi:hypothetical protein